MKKCRVLGVRFKVMGGLFFILYTLHFTLYTVFSGEPATITGDKMKILQKGDILEFIGNVKLVQQNLTISCDKMKSNEKTGMVEGYGNITVKYSSGTENTYAWGDTAEYNKNSGSGIFTGNIKVKRILRDTTNSLDLTCDKLEVFDAGNRFHAIKNVRITQPYTVATSDEAFYDQKTKEILLLGGPPKVVRADEKGYSEYSGDKISIITDTEVFTILGNVKTKIVLK